MALIDRGKLAEIFTEYFSSERHSNGFRKGGMAAKRLIYQQPVVNAVEIVHCKDCKHWGVEGRCNLLSATRYTLTMGADAYCSYGEREESPCCTD